MVSVRCFDGVGTIGGNKILLQDGKVNIWFDFGLNLGMQSEYYEEYLKAKTCTGLFEPINMGLLPAIKDLYRTDLCADIADPWHSVNAETIGDVAGVLISHGHLDHIGALHFVREDAPIYCSLATLMMMKGSQDSMGGAIQGEYCYTVNQGIDDNGLLSKLHHTKTASMSRPFWCVGEEPSPALRSYWDWTPSSDLKSGRKHAGSYIEPTDTCGGLKLKRFPVDHSVYGASAWAVETSAGWVVYTGDLRAHGHYSDFTWKFAEEAAKLQPRLLIIEGTRITEEMGGTEKTVAQLALEEVKKADALVVADFGLRHIERLVSFLAIAKQTGRKLAILPKDAYLLYAMRLAGKDQYIPELNENIAIYWEYQSDKSAWRKKIKEEFESLGIRPRDVAENQDKFICCFSFFDVNELAYLKPKPGSKWIYSSNEAFSEDLKIDFDRLGNWVDRFGMDFPGDPRVEKVGDPAKSPFHVSGHACRDDLLKLVEIIRPQEVVPVHTLQPEQFTDALKGICTVTLPERGSPINL